MVENQGLDFIANRALMTNLVHSKRFLVALHRKCTHTAELSMAFIIYRTLMTNLSKSQPFLSLHVERLFTDLNNRFNDYCAWSPENSSSTVCTCNLRNDLCRVCILLFQNEKQSSNVKSIDNFT